MRFKCIAVVCVLILIGALAQSACASDVRPYLKLGYLLNGPSASDLAFQQVGGGDLDQYLDVSKTNFGAGVQFFPYESSKMFNGYNVRLGIDVGVQRLFTSEYQSDPDAEHWKTHETAINFLGVAELAPLKKPLFFQAGLGLDFVPWSEEADYHGVPVDLGGTEATSGTGTNFAFMIAGGWNIPLSPNASLPIMLRIDNVFRYGSLTTISAVVGVNFKI